jgi:rod shape-determining protein MreC
LAVLDSSVRRSASSSFSSRAASALKRRIVVVALVVLSLALITVSFRESSHGPLHSVQNVGAAVLRPFEIATDRVARPFRDAYNWFGGLVTARSENQKLKAQLQEYRQKYVAAQAAQNENRVLQQLLRYERGASFPTDYTAVNASVIARAPGVFRQRITISAGSNRGIKQDDPVVTADGLVGKVTSVTPDVSGVTLLTDATSAVAAIDLTTGASGLVQHGAGGGKQLIFGRVPKEQVVQVGDIVITAGTQLGALPDIYPKGIEIGKVSSVNQNSVDSFKQILIQPFAGFSSLDSVAVLIARKGKLKP